MSKAAVAMLKGLLAQIEAGELVVTDASVSGDTVELQGGAVRPTGEENWYITTRPTVLPKATHQVTAVVLRNFGAGSNSSSVPALVHRPYTPAQLANEVTCLVDEYRSGHIRLAEFYDRAVPLQRKLVTAVSTYGSGSLEYAQLVGAAALLQRAFYYV